MLDQLVKTMTKIWLIVQDDSGYIRQAYPIPDSTQLTYPFVLTDGTQVTDVGAYGRGGYGYASFGDSQR